MKTIKTKSIIAIVALTLICVAAILFSEKQSQIQSISSQTIQPYVCTIAQKQVISGNLYPVKEIEVKSTIPGVLETYYSRVGDKIKVGDKIAKIKVLSEPSQIEQAKVNLKTAYITFEKDQIDYERDKLLFDKRLISLSDLEDVAKTFRISQEQYEYAKNRLQLLEDGYISSSQVSNVVVATANGTLIDLPLEEGITVVERNNFRDGTTVALIAQLDSFVFKGKIVESDVLTLKRGMKLSIIPTSMSSFNTEAIVRKISPKGYWDQGTMKYDIEASFTLPDSIMIYSGFNATAEFIMKEKRDVLTIPESCLKFSNDSVYVEVLVNGKFEKKYVEVGISDGINIEIANGVDKNYKIKK